MQRRTFLSVTLAASLGTQPLIAATSGDCVASQVWEVSTRHLSCSVCSLADPSCFDVHRWGSCSWQKSSIDEAVGPANELGEDPLTIVYVHGNWMERCNALERVRIVDRHIKARACEPYRLIMLSWPSQHEDHFLREVRDNAQCADVQSFYLVWLLRALRNTSSRIAILGFSFGARTVTGGLHLEAGGTIFGRPASQGVGFSGAAEVESIVETPMHRVSLVAPAVDRGWLAPNGRYGRAMNQVEHLVNLYNSRDPILRRFRFIDNLARPIAAGFAGLGAVADPPSTTPLQTQDRIEQYDCGESIGSTHSEVSYYGECPCFRIAIDNLLWKPF